MLFQKIFVNANIDFPKSSSLRWTIWSCDDHLVQEKVHLTEWRAYIGQMVVQLNWSSGYGYGRRLTSKRSWVWILAPDTGRTFFHINCCKNCFVCLKRPKINEKEAMMAHFLKVYFRGRHSSVDLSAPLTLRSRDLIPRIRGYHLCFFYVLYYICHRIEKRTKIKGARFGPFF